jgi:hypothetical protein
LPIRNIQTAEYECGYCGYKWINRINGKDGLIPKNCARCKRSNWNNPDDVMTYEEIGLRRKIRGFGKKYYTGYILRFDIKDEDINWPYDISEVFLRIDNPRPTIAELTKIVYPFGKDFIKRNKWIPDPHREGWFMRNLKIAELMGREYEKRKRYMLKIIKERGIKYDVTLGIKKMRGYTKEDSRSIPELIQKIKDQWRRKGK